MTSVAAMAAAGANAKSTNTRFMPDMNSPTPRPSEKLVPMSRA